MKYTHRVKIGTVQLQIRYGFSDETIQKYYKDGYLYGYYADGILLGDVIEFAEGHVAFEYGLQHHNEIEEVGVEQKYYAKVKGFKDEVWNSYITIHSEGIPGFTGVDNAEVFSIEEWANLGINDSNADFVEVEEMGE